MRDSQLSVRAISKTFHGKRGDVHAVRNISFDIHEGEVLCLLGPNGSGKTTTLRIACGLLAPDSGHVEIMGESPIANMEVLGKLGVMLEGSRNSYPYLSALENVKYYARISGLSSPTIDRRAEDLLYQLNLAERFRDPVQNFSLGMQQKVALACVLIHNPPILLLDEPTSALDVITKREIITSIKQMRDDGKSILLMTHQMDVAEKVSSRILILKEGQIIREGTPKSLTQYLEANRFEIKLQDDINQLPDELRSKFDVSLVQGDIVLNTTSQDELLEFMKLLHSSGSHILSISRNLSLEDNIIRIIEEGKEN